MHLDQRDYDKEPGSKGERIFLIVLFLVFFFMMSMALLSDYEPKKLGAILFLIFWIPLLFIHEFGHALMAKVLGWHVTRIVIGVGKVFTITRLFGAPMEIRMMPLEGFVQIAPNNVKFARFKHALIYFAGPGIELLLFFIIVLYFGGFEHLFSADNAAYNNSYPHIALKSFAFAALAGAVINLIPIGIITKDGSTPNDGMGILLCLFATEMDYETWINEAQKESDNEHEC